MEDLTAYERVTLARAKDRATTVDFINEIFTDFIELAGDRKFADDKSILGGTAYFKGKPVIIIAHRKGKNLEENLLYNFGMPGPEGFRKAERLMQLADKFNLPIITFVDTKGAFPGLEAENRGQGEAIARCLYTISSVNVPVISVVTSEGGSGGALALAVSNHLIMLENAIFSVLSPEGFASILWKNSDKVREASEIMKLTSYDLLKYNVADEIVLENENDIFDSVSNAIEQSLDKLKNKDNLAQIRYKKIRNIGLALGKEN